MATVSRVTPPATEAAEQFVGLADPVFSDEDIEEVARTLRSGWVIAGPNVGAFERMLEDYTGAPHVACLSSCSAGLLLALHSASVGPGDEVLVPALTFAACPNVVEQLRATPVFVDCDPATGLVDLDHAASLVGERTVALIAVHLGGRPLDPGALNRFRDRHGLLVVEDAAHAIGARWGERPVGAYGNPTSFSFHATKNMTTLGSGGALAMDGSALAERTRRLAAQGVSASAWQRHGTATPGDYDVIEPGYKLAMTDVEAAVGVRQLGRLDAGIDARERISQRYDEAFADSPVELEPSVEPGVRHARHLYRVRVRDEAAATRDQLLPELRARGIGASVHFKPLHTLTHFARRSGLAPEALPGSFDLGRRTVSLPLHPRLDEQQVERVIGAVQAVLSP